MRKTNPRLPLEGREGAEPLNEGNDEEESFVDFGERCLAAKRKTERRSRLFSGETHI